MVSSPPRAVLCTTSLSRLLRTYPLAHPTLPLPRWSLPLLWPYHLGLRIKLGVQRKVDDEPLYDEILPGVYLAGWPESAAALPAGPTPLAVIDCTCELPRVSHDSSSYSGGILIVMAARMMV